MCSLERNFQRSGPRWGHLSTDRQPALEGLALRKPWPTRVVDARLGRLEGGDLALRLPQRALDHPVETEGRTRAILRHEQSSARLESAGGQLEQRLEILLDRPEAATGRRRGRGVDQVAGLRWYSNT